MSICTADPIHGHSTKCFLGVAIAAALLPGTLQAQSAQPPSTAAATYVACYVKTTGTVYRIKTANAPQDCKSGHVEFSWQEEGAPGPAGPAGPEGPAGPQGPPGAPGSVRAYAVVSGTGALDLSRSRGFASASSPSTGKYCLTPEPGISPELHPALVSQTGDALAALSWNPDLIGAGFCAPGQYGVSGFSTSSGANMGVGFTIIVP